MNVQIDDEVGQAILGEDDVRALVEHTLAGEGLPESYEVSVSFVTRDEIHQLNREYRGIDRPTDVLSFVIDDPNDEDETAGPGDEGEEADGGEPDEPMLGDVIICPDIVAAQAPGFGNTPADEMRLLLVHGCLHLMGYDHEEPEEAQEMEALERTYLAPFSDAPASELNVGPTVDHAAEGSAAWQGAHDAGGEARP